MSLLKSAHFSLKKKLEKALKLEWTKCKKIILAGAAWKLLVIAVSIWGLPPLFQDEPIEATRLPLDMQLTLDRKEIAKVSGDWSSRPQYESNLNYLSEVFIAEHPFDLLSLHWQEQTPSGTAAQIQIRFKDQKGQWSGWMPLIEDHDEASHDTGHLEEGYEKEAWSYLITDQKTAFQYRADLSTADAGKTPKLSELEFDYIRGGETALFKRGAAALEKLVFDSNAGVVSRKDWGANEDYRLASFFGYEGTPPFTSELDADELEEEPDLANKKRVDTDEEGNPLLWPLEYPKAVKKLIVHHTATTDFLDDPAAAVRAIYYYHAVTRGWGDIGYNFIVAPDGQVFEGRFGGDGVVAGHAHGHNTGSVGIALLGNYQEADLSGAMMQGLEGILYQKAKLHKIDPNNSSAFHGENLPNLIGHRDVESTACPGENTVDFLPELRATLGRALAAETAENKAQGDYAFKEVGDRELVLLTPGEKKGITLKLKNTGTKTWDKATYLLVTPREGADKKVSFPVDSQNRSAVMSQTSVAPGETASFNFKISALAEGGFSSWMIQPVYNGKFKTAQSLEWVSFIETPNLNFELTESEFPKTLTVKETVKATIKLRNESNLTWTNTGDDAIVLKQVGASTLSSEKILATMNESSVKPEGEASFTFSLTAGASAGTASIYLTIAQKDDSLESATSTQLKFNIKSSSESALIVVHKTPLTMEPGAVQTVLLDITNNTKDTWSADQLTLQVTPPKGATAGTPKLGFKTLKPGKTAKAYFTLTAPAKEGRYTLTLNLLEGSKKLLSKAMQLTLIVKATESVEVTDLEHPVRIKLTPDDGVGNPILSADTDFTLMNGGTALKNFKADSRVRITPNWDAVATERFKVTSGLSSWTVAGPVKLLPQNDGIVTILTMSQIPAWNKDLNDNQFRGSVEILEDGGEAVLVNELELEDYLKGIGEVSNGDPIEKVKTILVLARSYAVFYTTQAEKFEGKPYDLDDDPNVSQKYLGYGFEKRSKNVADAVAATQGLVVTYKGKVVKTPYFSKSDGKATKSAKEVWGWTDTPWLVSVADTWCKSTKFEGHGVGLSGCGATELAKLGKTFEEIIKTYYTGVEIKNMDELTLNRL